MWFFYQYVLTKAIISTENYALRVLRRWRTI